MRAVFDRLLESACAEPLRSRRRLFAFLLEEPVYILHIGERAVARAETATLKPGDALSLWAETDSESDGVWVPLFRRPERVMEYAAHRRLRPPRGRHLNWMRHEGGWLYNRLLDIPCFSGLRLEPDAGGGVRLEWAEVNALSDGRTLAREPAVYALPGESYRLPDGCQCLLGESDGCLGLDGRPALFPDAGKLDREDLRGIVRLHVETQPAWTPCRHLISAIRAFAAEDKGAPHQEMLVDSLIEFEMYGEAEAACRRILRSPERGSFALASLAKTYRRSGRLERCIEVCRGAIEEYPDERQFYVNQSLAHAQMDEIEQAREVCRRGADRFPRDPALQRFL